MEKLLHFTEKSCFAKQFRVSTGEVLYDENIDVINGSDRKRTVMTKVRAQPT